MRGDGFLNIENEGTSMKRAEIQQRGKLFPTGVLKEEESDKDPAGHRFWRERKESQKGGQNKQCARTEKPRMWSVGRPTEERKTVFKWQLREWQSSAFALKEPRVRGKNTGLREFPLLTSAKWSWEKLVYLGFSFLTCKTEHLALKPNFL